MVRLTSRTSFVCVVNSEIGDVEQLTSYERDVESMSTFHDNIRIWEAARATSAATSFFDPISIGRGNLRQSFVDGATGANNPVRRLWQEAQRQWASPLEPQI
jgi:patatin-like phospholipase/acyl hydrolase